MRPHLLELCAFGPFADTQRVDFDDVGAAGLLLLHGETGAGKTSVLDAVGFALFGDVPGERGVRGLRSEHAPAAVETWVRLEFSAGGRRWRVRRTPRQQVAKVRGEGSTLRQPSALLEEPAPGGGWRAVATRLDEVGQCVRDAVGLSAAQFFQVVLLPQGRFAAFLHAPADERQALLQQLFATSRFADVERLLKDRRAALVEAAAHGRREAAAQVAAVAAAAGLDAAPDGAPDGAGADWARGVLVGLAARLEAAEAAVEDAATAEATAADRLLDAEALATRQQRLRAVLDQHQRLAARAASVEDERRTVALARAAAPAAATLARLDAREAERVAVGAAVAAATAATAATAAVDPVEPADLLELAGLVEPTDPAGVAARERRLRDEAAAARSALADERELTDRRRQVAALAAAAAEADRREAARAADVVAAEAALRAAADALAAAEATAAGHADAVALAEAAARRLAAAEELPARRLAAADAREAYADAREAALEARSRWLDAAGRRLAGMAAELAAGLADGEPCRVCGAVEHPAPARPAGSVVTADDESAAREAAEAAEAAVEPLRVAAEAAAARLAALVAVLGAGGTGDLPGVPALRAEHERAAEAALAAGAAARALPGRHAGLAAAEQAVAAARAEAAAAVAAARAAAREVAAADAAVAEQAAAVDAARGADGSVAARVARLEREADALGELADLLRRDADLAAEVGELRRELGAAAAAAGFADAAALRAAVRPPGDVAAAEARLRAHDDELAAVTARLADDDLRVPLDPPADPAAARADAVAAKAALHRATVARGALEERCRQAQAAVRRLEPAERELGPVLAELDTVQRLAELAAGGVGNRLRMSLTSFVLAARLEAVAARASVRLGHMTSGRYSLVHSDEVVDGRRRGGLGLAVQDVWTGTTRPTSSLSGGETFMTALALALGLADVVAEEAGGRQIDTLFVDEGFGSLDEQALDRVMEVLDGLRDGGRLVGLVSHVPELQRRVPARLEVIRTESGSWLRPCPAPVHD